MYFYVFNGKVRTKMRPLGVGGQNSRMKMRKVTPLGIKKGGEGGGTRAIHIHGMYLYEGQYFYILWYYIAILKDIPTNNE